MMWIWLAAESILCSLQLRSLQLQHYVIAPLPYNNIPHTQNNRITVHT
jgi:hypothetical protein